MTLQENRHCTWLHRRILLTRQKAVCKNTKNINMERPTWLYCGCTSYEQTDWLHRALLVKRISCLVSQSGSVRRQAAMTLTLKKPDAKTCLHIPCSSAMQKKAITRKRPTWLSHGFTYHKQAEWLRTTRYMSAGNNKASTLIGGLSNKVVLYLKITENVGWKVIRRVNLMDKFENI